MLPEQIMDFLKLEQVDPHGHGKAIIDHNSHPIHSWMLVLSGPDKMQERFPHLP